jgi:DNA polymerase V
MIALLDCNNFYVSCEKVFQPFLDNKPVIVLSSNDGCVIFRSNEAKLLGIKMGVPFFTLKELLTQHQVFVYSSNYALYADLLQRVMSILTTFAPRQEVYSIDEAFLDLTGIANLTAYAAKIRNTVKQYTSIPVGIGIGKTKVLAKFANYLAKKYAFLDGICNLAELGTARVDKAMQITPVEELWGIGKRIASKLKQMGINNGNSG